ncbi:MAG: bifunctional UDP-3-O-[3-hydroxymyristoyl] N-acetylglucosamine deacetylase/3-hydroxyacyl-ACP dehydratase [Bacteroidetes bacterium]|nr:bifunctional UDP-3-O-[3-hydroxymyristoyl] N-acetylglucosamine deacetylase/3-hydroxyacyl-ACP dehydratase [Bacteroidota bacterium]
MAEKQKTIREAVTISGVGLHTGKEVNITFKPAPENHGYKFKRIDIEGHPIVDANIDFVVDTSRGTTLEQNGVRVCTIEHTLAALSGLSIDNILIEMDCMETPIMDGSSAKYVEVLLKAGIVEQEADREYLEIDSNISFTDADKKVEIIAIPCDEFKVSVMIDYDVNVISPQHASLNKISDFKNEIASCRTFVFLHELEYLVKNNLIKGGDLNNAIVFVNRVITDDELDHLAELFNRPKVAVLKEGILNNVELRFQNEPARHKLLDVVGDVALLGKPLKAHIIASRPGHFSNIQFAKKLKQHIKQIEAKKDIPVYDPDAIPLHDINAIKKILPHRPPFLLIDKIIEISEDSVVGLKNVTMNESFFNGHFPDEPVMPGVLQIEAMAQTGGIFALSTVPDPENYLTYFLKIENARFKQKVVPGDTLIFKLSLLSPVRRGICHMKGVAYVGSKIVMEAELLAQISKIKQ